MKRNIIFSYCAVALGLSFIHACGNETVSGSEEMRFGGKRTRGQAQTSVASKFGCTDPSQIEQRSSSQKCVGSNPLTGAQANVWIVQANNPWGNKRRNKDGVTYTACVNVINGNGEAIWFNLDGAGNPSFAGQAPGSCYCWLEGDGAATAKNYQAGVCTGK